MAKNPRKPREFDAVLGGQVSPPISGAVLGGIEGLHQRFADLQEQVRLDALADALSYGNEGINILVKALKDASLQVRVSAYKILKQLNQALEETAKGVRLNVGDKIYCVYRSSLYYGDDWFYLRDTIHGIEDEDEDYYEYEEESEENLFYKSQSDDGDGYAYYITSVKENKEYFTSEYYKPVFISPHISKQEAEKAAEILHRKRLLQVDAEFGMILGENYYEKEQLKQWCQENNLSINYSYNENLDAFKLRVYIFLQENLNIELINKLWEYTLTDRRLAFVHEFIIDRKCYLRPNDNL